MTNTTQHVSQHLYYFQTKVRKKESAYLIKSIKHITHNRKPDIKQFAGHHVNLQKPIPA